MSTEDSANARRATVMLLLTTLFWGLSFPLVNGWQAVAPQALGSPVLAALTIIAVRMFPALLILLVARPALLRGSRREHAVGALLGIVFFTGVTLQTCGLAWTTPARSAFITGLSSAWAPLIGWLFVGFTLQGATLVGLLFGVIGTVVLGLDLSEPWGFGIGELLTVASSLLFGVQIVLLDRLGRNLRAERLSLSFFVVAGVLGLSAGALCAFTQSGVADWVNSTTHLLTQTELLLRVSLLILLPTVLSFHWMNTYQPQVTAARAALLYLLEPLFTACFSIPLGLDTLTWRLVIGGALILLGNAVVEWRALTRLVPRRSSPRND